MPIRCNFCIRYGLRFFHFLFHGLPVLSSHLLVAFTLSVTGLISCGHLAHTEESLEARKSRIEQMDAGKKETLKTKFNRFHALDSRRQQELREMHLQLSKQPELRQTLESYFHWLKTLTVSEVAELKTMSIEDRIRHIKWLQNQPPRAEKPPVDLKGFSMDDIRVARHWAMNYIPKHDAEITKLHPKIQKHFGRGRDPRQRWDPSQRLRILQLVDRLPENEIQQLRDQLSSALNDRLEASSDVEKRHLLHQLLEVALKRPSPDMNKRHRRQLPRGMPNRVRRFDQDTQF